MIESLFQNQGPPTSRGAIYSPAPARGKSPLEQFLANQQFGKQQAGNTAPTYHQLGPTPTITAPTFAPAQGAAPSVDPSAISSFYSDPANADYHSDPALLGIKAADNTTRDNADVSALASRRGLLAQFGDQGLASKVLGADDPTMGAISADPDKSTSVLARLARNYRDTTAANEDARNKGNLWYSSTRAEGLNNDARDYSTAQADATANVQSQLDAISRGLASAKGGADSADAQAEQDAFQRYLAAIAAHPATSTPGGAPAAGIAPSDLGATVDQAGPMNTVDYNPAGIMGQGAASYGAPGESNAGSTDAAANTISTTLGGMPSYNYDSTGASTYGSVPDAASALSSFLGPQKKPVSGYAAGSGAHLR